MILTRHTYIYKSRLKYFPRSDHECSLSIHQEYFPGWSYKRSLSGVFVAVHHLSGKALRLCEQLLGRGKTYEFSCFSWWTMHSCVCTYVWACEGRVSSGLHIECPCSPAALLGRWLFFFFKGLFFCSSWSFLCFPMFGNPQHSFIVMLLCLGKCMNNKPFKIVNSCVICIIAAGPPPPMHIWKILSKSISTHHRLLPHWDFPHMESRKPQC